MGIGEQCSMSCCPLMVGRRSFLAAAGVSALVMKVGILDFASELFAAEVKPAKKPTVRAVFLRPDSDRYWMGWPGAAYDVKAMQATYTKTLTDAAEKLGVQLDVVHKPLVGMNDVNAYLGQLKKAPPAGLIATIMPMGKWQHVNHLVAGKGNIPTVVFSPMGTSFTHHLQPTRNAAGTFVAATQDYKWLAHGLRMLKTIRDMKTSRICIAAGNKTVDRPLDVIGTTLHYIPRNRFVEEFKKLDTTDEMRAIAAYYEKEAKKIVEPSKKDILDGVKMYVVCRRLMARENCHGYSMDCLGVVGSRQAPPPCLAFSRLRDEGIVGACEADWGAAISSRLTHLLFGRPGFMQDPAPNSVNNTLMGAHCTCATKLDGFDKPHEPFILRSHSESNLGVAPQVLWKLGQKVTIMKFQKSNSIILGTGKVVANIDTPPSGGCRTSVELELDDVPDARDAKGFHQLFIYGDLEKEFMAYCQLAGIKVVHLCRISAPAPPPDGQPSREPAHAIGRQAALRCSVFGTNR